MNKDNLNGLHLKLSDSKDCSRWREMIRGDDSNGDSDAVS